MSEKRDLFLLAAEAIRSPSPAPATPPPPPAPQTIIIQAPPPPNVIIQSAPPTQAEPISKRIASIPSPSNSVSIVEAELDQHPVRFTLFGRSGHVWSYPYGYVGLIECPSPGEIMIYCTCGDVVTIAIRGRQLARVATLLSSHRLVSLREDEHPEFVTNGPVIEEIAVNFSKPEAQEL